MQHTAKTKKSHQADILSDKVTLPLFNIIGHEREENILRKTFLAGKMPQAWLFNGPKSIGKSCIAYKIASEILSIHNKDKENTIKTKVFSNSHPDLLVIKQEKEDNLTEGEIKIEQIRKIKEFLPLSPYESLYKIVIIDAVDQLNINAANALLKCLEDPLDNVFFFVINHNESAVLPTILSRTVKLKFSKLKSKKIEQILANSELKINSEQLKLISTYALGCPGMAIILEKINIEHILGNFLLIIKERKQFNYTLTLKLVEDLAGKNNEVSLAHIFYVLYVLCARIIEQETGNLAYNSVLPIENEVFTAIKSGINLKKLIALQEYLSTLITSKTLVNLEKRSLLLNLLTEFRNI